MKIKSLVVMVGLLGLSAIGCTKEKPIAIKPTRYYYEQHDVDQIFRDHNGYRLIWDDSNEAVNERKYLCSGGGGPFPDSLDWKFRALNEHKSHVVIFRDLEQGKQGYAEVVNYWITYPDSSYTLWEKFAVHREYRKRGEGWFHYVEIHLPKNQQLLPGEEVYYRGKFLRHGPISEVK
jgi:hypothetical protein